MRHERLTKDENLNWHAVMYLNPPSVQLHLNIQLPLQLQLVEGRAGGCQAEQG